MNDKPTAITLPDQALEELNALLRFASPEQLKRTLLELFFAYLIESEVYPENHKDIVENTYFMVDFLNKMEDTLLIKKE